MSVLSPSSGSRPMNRGVWNRLLGSRHPPRRRRQGFAPTGDDDPGFAESNGAHAEQDRIEAGCALAVHGERGDAVPEARGEADDAGRIASRRGIAEDDLVDRAGLESCVLERGQHHGRREALDAPALVQAAGPAERGTARGDDVCRSQRRGRGHGERIRHWKPAAPPAAGSGSSPVTPQEHGEILPVARFGESWPALAGLAGGAAMRRCYKCADDASRRQQGLSGTGARSRPLPRGGDGACARRVPQQGSEAHALAAVGVPRDRGVAQGDRRLRGARPAGASGASGWRRSRSTGRSRRWLRPASCTASKAATPSLPAMPATRCASSCWPARPAGAWRRSTATRCSPPSTRPRTRRRSPPRAPWSRSGDCAPTCAGEGREPRAWKRVACKTRRAAARSPAGRRGRHLCGTMHDHDRHRPSPRSRHDRRRRTTPTRFSARAGFGLRVRGAPSCRASTSTSPRARSSR